jgi:hypothetical protein
MYRMKSHTGQQKRNTTLCLKTWHVQNEKSYKAIEMWHVQNEKSYRAIEMWHVQNEKSYRAREMVKSNSQLNWIRVNAAIFVTVFSKLQLYHWL